MSQNISLDLQQSYLTLPDIFYSEQSPRPVRDPQIVILNSEFLKDIGIDISYLTDKEKAKLFSGNVLPEDAKPYAQAYAGHQFGNFTMLGDGRAHMLGEYVLSNGSHVDIQYKGTGRTQYSRGGDGRAALEPMLREYIISEAMHSLGIPTTRSVAVVSTGEDIIRENMLPGAILTRLASSHIRFGTFEFAAMQFDHTAIEALLDYTIERHLPEAKEDKCPSLYFLNTMVERQAGLIANWMRIGFIHGVMNTDNMTISGETIDYGPCAFMDRYDPNAVFSSIDHMGRYAFANQPRIAHWNLARLAEALLPCLDEDQGKAIKKAEETINKFPELYKAKWLKMMRAKLGLFDAYTADEELISDLLDLMHKNTMDYTNTFRELSNDRLADNVLYERRVFKDWYERWQDRLKLNKLPLRESYDLMKKTNPALIPRNHNVEKALQTASAGNIKPLKRLLSALKNPYIDKVEQDTYKELPSSDERVYQTFCGT